MNQRTPQPSGRKPASAAELGTLDLVLGFVPLAFGVANLNFERSVEWNVWPAVGVCVGLLHLAVGGWVFSRRRLAFVTALVFHALVALGLLVYGGYLVTYVLLHGSQFGLEVPVDCCLGFTLTYYAVAAHHSWRLWNEDLRAQAARDATTEGTGIEPRAGWDEGRVTDPPDPAEPSDPPPPPT